MRRRSSAGLGAPPAGAGDRPRLDAVALDGDERLGARAAEGEVVEGDVVQVWARVHGADAAIDRERRDVGRRAEALGQHDLERVAGVDVVTDALHARLVLRAAHGRGDGAVRGRRIGADLGCVDHAPRRAGGEGRGQLGAHVRDALHGALVGAVDVAPVDERVGDDRDGVLEVVEHEYRVGQQERHLGQAEVVRRRVRERLQAPHQVVAEVADEAAGERRQRCRLAARRRPVAAHEVGDGGERVVVLEAQPLAVLLHGEAPVRVGHEGAGADAEEREAAQVLALLGALQEEPTAGRTELEERRDGGLEIGDERVGDGQDVVGQCEAARLD